jgi:NAD(P) transhydrogenase subunit beta
MLVINLTYFTAAVLFILGLKQMSSPVTARRGIVVAGIGMVLATLITFLHPKIHGLENYALIILAIAIGGLLAWWSGQRVAMTDMPQMIALYNGMGGGAAAGIGIVALLQGNDMSLAIQCIATIGVLIGAVAFSGSIIAYAKLQDIIRKAWRFGGQQMVNMAVFALALFLGVWIALSGNDVSHPLLASFVALSLLFGVLMTLPIGGADMPVVISLYNAMTGLAVGFKGLVLDNPALMIAGVVVGAAGTLLTSLMAKAMNRSVSNVLFSGFGETGAAMATENGGSLKPIEASDAGVMLAFAEKVIVVPGYGMAVAQAQHKIWELCQLLGERNVKVAFAIHPVAGRMPGHMNVLLAEAGVPYDMIYDLDEINNDFESADVALIIGANDVVNPVARTDPSSPIYGMPILNADKAKNVIVIKRGKGAGFSGIENALFFLDQTRMLYGDGQAAASELIQAVKTL